MNNMPLGKIALILVGVYIIFLILKYVFIFSFVIFSFLVPAALVGLFLYIIIKRKK